MRTHLYFAYGSNLCLPRIRKRAPSATPIAIGCLPGYQILFHKRSVDGSGKCTIQYNGSDEDLVFGVLYMMDSDEKQAMDDVEGVGTGYREGIIGVLTPQGQMEASTYIATDTHIDESLQPYQWYLDYVLAGARQHGLPEYYISSLRDVMAVQDPDSNRAAVNRSISSCGLIRHSIPQTWQYR